MIIRDVLLDGRPADVRVNAGVVVGIGAVGSLGERSAPKAVVDGAGGALIPGLHDHHLHLLATAAAARSVDCGPPSVRTAAELRTALADAPGTGWIRGVGYDEAVAGDLDRHGLDELSPDRPVRVQHRGGSLWVINSAGLALLGRDAPVDGRLFRRDDWLRERLGEHGVPSLTALGAELAACGVTGITDATPGPAGVLARAVQQLPQRVVSLGDTTGTDLAAGPRKIVLGDHELPSYDRLITMVGEARAEGRAVAVHSVTRASLVLLLAVLDEAGAVPGDRVEHAAVAPPEAVEDLARRGIAVVTQPSLVARRGDDYLDRVEADDLPHLWRYGSLLDAGVAVACSSDAPYGDPDPWATIRAAHDRTTASGRVLGSAERVEASVALDGFLADPLSPGGPPRRVTVGAPADLVLLDGPLAEVLADPDARHVKLTMIDGNTVYERGNHG